MLDDHTANWELTGLPVDLEYDVWTTNSIFIAWIESLGNHIKRLSTKIKAEIQNADSFSWEFAFGSTGMDLYQLHTLTISYFEIGSFLIVSDELRCAPPSKNTKRLVEAIYARKGHVLDESDNYGQRQRNAFKRLQSDQNLNVGFYKFVLSESGLLDSSESDILKRVNSIRGDLVHNIFTILDVNSQDRALELVNDCQALREAISGLLFDNVEFEPEIYDLLLKMNNNSD